MPTTDDRYGHDGYEEENVYIGRKTDLQRHTVESVKEVSAPAYTRKMTSESRPSEINWLPKLDKKPLEPRKTGQFGQAAQV